MYNLNIEINVTDIAEISYILEMIGKQIDEGFTSGFDNNDSSDYGYNLTDDEGNL